MPGLSLHSRSVGIAELISKTNPIASDVSAVSLMWSLRQELKGPKRVVPMIDLRRHAKEAMDKGKVRKLVPKVDDV